MYEQILIAGFGGQGVLTCGQILALAAMFDGKKVTWMPSYGPEQRGGTASCVVTISSQPIGSPLPENLTAAIIFNKPSLVKFEPRIKSGGVLVLNSSIIKVRGERADILSYRVPADEIARRTGLAKAANIVLLGSFLAMKNVVSEKSLENALKEYLGKSKQHLVEVNLKALAAGQIHMGDPAQAV
ncbi:MAG: 2-oxoacid:acceptor oxidoreductase family protein [Bacillota bacterium]